MIPEPDQNTNQTPHLNRFPLELLTIKHLQLHPFVSGFNSLSTHPTTVFPETEAPSKQCASPTSPTSAPTNKWITVPDLYTSNHIADAGHRTPSWPLFAIVVDRAGRLSLGRGGT